MGKSPIIPNHKVVNRRIPLPWQPTKTLLVCLYLGFLFCTPEYLAAENAQLPSEKNMPLSPTLIPTPFNRAEGDQQKNDFYQRYFRKGKVKGGNDLPLSPEEKKARLKALFPKPLPTPKEDKQETEIDRLIMDLGAEPHRRAMAVERLATIGKPAVMALRAALHDTYMLKRIGSLEALSYIQAAEALPDIQALLRDPDGKVRAEAVRTLGRMKYRMAVSSLAVCLEDPEKKVRSEAVQALSRIKGKIACEALIGALKNTLPEIRQQAAEELSLFEGPAVLEALLHATRDESREVRISAIRSLGDLGDTGARPRLRELSESDDRMLRQEALQALSDLSP